MTATFATGGKACDKVALAWIDGTGRISQSTKPYIVKREPAPERRTAARAR